MQKEVVSKEVMQELINKLEEIVNNYCWNLESFTDEDINSFFDGTEEEVTYYKSLIVDSIESTSFLWSSKKIAESIANTIISANEYTNSLLKNISSIQLEWCETNLPTTGENNKIYILPVTSESTTVNTLNIWNSTTCEFISIGNLEIDLTNYYTKTETDEKLDLKANADEVISNDKIVQTLDSTTNSSDTILSTNGLQVELDKKANDDEVIKKTDITTTINSTSTDTQVPSAKSVWNNIKKNGLIWQGVQELQNSQESTIFDYCKKFASGCIYGFRLKPKDASGYFTSSDVTIIYCLSSVNYGWILGISDKIGIPMAIIQIIGNLKKWQRICTTSVADVATTNMTFSNDTNYKISTNAPLQYCVSNGMCTVSGGIDCVTPVLGGVYLDDLPKPKLTNFYNYGFNVNGEQDSDTLVFFVNSTTGKINIRRGVAGHSYRVGFSYPVAES